MIGVEFCESIISDSEKNVNITLKQNQTLEIRNAASVRKPSYIMVASGYNTGKSMNYTKELLAMTSQEAFVFDILMDNRDTPYLDKPYIKSNYTYIDNSTLTKNEKKKVYEGYKRLRSKDLVIRISRGKYLINPKLVITNDDLYVTELVAYNRLVEKL
jgi:hypothetical protein